MSCLGATSSTRRRLNSRRSQPSVRSGAPIGIHFSTESGTMLRSALLRRRHTVVYFGSVASTHAITASDRDHTPYGTAYAPTASVSRQVRT
jgi:hypothetical protein